MAARVHVFQWADSCLGYGDYYIRHIAFVDRTIAVLNNTVGEMARYAVLFGTKPICAADSKGGS